MNVGEPKNVTDCLKCVSCDTIGMVLKMVHDAYYKREVVSEPKKKQNKTERKVKSVPPKVIAKPKKTGKINTNIGHLQSTQNSSNKGDKSMSSSSSQHTSKANEDESTLCGSSDEDEVLFIKEEPNRAKKIPAIITIQKVSVTK